MVRALAVCAFGSCWMTSCQKRPALYSYQPVDVHGWACTDTLRFTLTELPQDSLCTFSVGVRTSEHVPYQNLWLVLERRWGEDFRQRDTVELRLTDAQGEWQTQGNILHEEEVFVTAKKYNAKQLPLELLVYHLMRQQRLTGVMEVGVKVD